MIAAACVASIFLTLVSLVVAATYGDLKAHKDEPLSGLAALGLCAATIAWVLAFQAGVLSAIR